MAVFVDLDRSLLRGTSGGVFDQALRDAGLIRRPHLPIQAAIYRSFDLFGESLPAMALARLAAPLAKGWEQAQVRQVANSTLPLLLAKVAPYAPTHLARWREEGHALVLATTTPRDLVEPLAEALGFDDVIATTYAVNDGHYSGAIEGSFTWGTGKLDAVKAWASERGLDLADCHACSDSVFDAPLLSAVGHPHAVNPDPRLQVLAKLKRWPVEHWDRPEGVPSFLGAEPYHFIRPFVRAQLMPYAQLSLEGEVNLPHKGPAIVISNHRSYFDVAALAVLAAKLKRPIRFLGKAELFANPFVAAFAKSIGGIRVDRGVDGAASYEAALEALKAGEVVFLLPEGTIPRGEAFFDPQLKGKTGAVRLAQASGAKIVPVGLWGTEKVWPRSAKLPSLLAVIHPPAVLINVGEPFFVGEGDPHAETAIAMAAISALLPDGGVVEIPESKEALRRTMPDGQLPGEA
ncbi:MAG: HAD-IB family hydrolase [Actinomycetes bacterium]